MTFNQNDFLNNIPGLDDVFTDIDNLGNSKRKLKPSTSFTVIKSERKYFQDMKGQTRR